MTLSLLSGVLAELNPDLVALSSYCLGIEPSLYSASHMVPKIPNRLERISFYLDRSLSISNGKSLTRRKSFKMSSCSILSQYDAEKEKPNIGSETELCFEQAQA